MSLKNECRCIGRLVADPEYIEQANKTKFRIAINERYKQDKIVTFMNCVAFGNVSKYIRDYIKKGDLVTLRGPLRTYTYETRDGEKRNEINILIDEIERLSYNASNESRSNTVTKNESTQDDKRYKWKSIDWSNQNIPKWNDALTPAAEPPPVPTKENPYAWRDHDPEYYKRRSYEQNKTIIPSSNDYDPF